MQSVRRILITFLILTILVNPILPAVAYAQEKQSGSIQGETKVMPVLAKDPLKPAVLGLADFESSVESAHERLQVTVEKLEKKTYAANEDVKIIVNNPDNQKLDTQVKDSEGTEVGVLVQQVDVGTETELNITASNQLKPGKYTIEIKDEEGRTSTQDFNWGVLAINTDKGVYKPDDEASISIGVLDEEGEMVCDAQVTLDITRPDGKVDTLSTDNGKIVKHKVCDSKEFTMTPDFEAKYKVRDQGDYDMKLSAKTKNGTFTINEGFLVETNTPFSIKRTSATRLYPPLRYPMNIEVTANQDFEGVVTETVPESFQITPGVDAQSYDNLQTMYLDDNNPEAGLRNQVLGASDKIQMPFDGSFTVTQGFGIPLTEGSLRDFYTHYGLSGHDGVDFGVPEGTPLYAVDSGKILVAGNSDYGITVIIQHGWGRSYYGHLSKVNVDPDAQVAKGSLIGYSGNTGESTGPHLHFGMKPNSPDTNNGYAGKVDPMPYLPIGENRSLSAAFPMATAVLSATTSAEENEHKESLTEPKVSATPAVSPIPASASNSASLETSAASAAAQKDFELLNKEIQQEVAKDQVKDQVKVIKWKVSMKKGETTTLSYSYKSPKISPQFYLLGPLKFFEGESTDVVYEENRSWQLAADAVPTTITFMEGGSDVSKGTAGSAGASTMYYRSTFGDITTNSTTVHSGLRSTRFNTGAGPSGAILTSNSGALGNNSRISMWVNYAGFPSTGANTISIMQAYDSNDSAFAFNPLTISSTGVLLLANETASATTALQLNTWHHVVVDWTLTSTSVNQFRLYIDGFLAASASNVSLTTINPSVLRFGFVSGTYATNRAVFIDDIYMDDGSDLDYPGPIRVAHKRPFSNGANNTWGVNGSAGGYGSNNARYVNEQPTNSANFLSTATANALENFEIEDSNVGDQDITGVNVVGYQGWVYASSTGTCTNPGITVNGTTSNITTSGTNTLFTRSFITSEYPSSSAKVGMRNCASGGGTGQMREAGISIAYTGSTLDTLMRHGQYFDTVNGQGAQPFTW